MKQKSLSKLADEQETTERLLDTAERLFGGREGDRRYDWPCAKRNRGIGGVRS